MDGFTAPADNRGEILDIIRKAVGSRGRKEWNEMRTLARKKILDKFTVERCVREHESLYRKFTEQKGPRRDAGPLTAIASPEIEIGESISLATDNMRDTAAIYIKRLAVNNGAIKTPLPGWAAGRLAEKATIGGRADLAHSLYRKLFESGAEETGWMKKWIEIHPEGPEREALAMRLLKLYPDDPQIVMTAVEESLKAGNISDAFTTIQEGLRVSPDSTELLEVNALLASRFNPGNR